MVDLRDTEYFKREVAKDKFIVYLTLKHRSNNVYKTREAIEEEVDEKMLLTMNDFLKDFESDQIINQCDAYMSTHFSPKSNAHIKELNEKLIGFYNDKRPSSSTIRAKEKAINILQEIIDKKHSGAKLYKYGSCASGLAVDSSDLDLTLIFPAASKYLPNSILSELQMCLKQQLDKTILKSAKTIKSNKPILILKLHIDKINIDVDISVQGHKTVYNSYILRQYTLIDVRLPIMAFLIKKWAKMNSLFGGSNKRFNSYSLTLLVIQFLQSGVRPAVLPYLNKEYPDLFKNNPDVKNLEVDKDLNVQFDRKNDMSVVELIAGFMEYYHVFEFEKYQPSILSSSFANRFNRIRYYRDNPICMVDPVFGDNPCRNVSFITLIQFREALAIFKEIARHDNKNLIEEFEVIFGFSNSSKISDALIVRSHFSWLLIW